MTRYRTRAFTSRPEEIKTAEDRGRALRNWFDVNTTPINGFAASMGVSRSTLNRYLKGESNIAEMDQPLAAALITAMGVTDSDVWEILGIPEEARGNFRTFRPPPWGHGQAVSEVREVHLAEPMVGEISFPAGTLLRIDPNGHDKPIQVVQLEDGRYYSVTALLLERAGGVYLGGLLSAHF